MRWAEVEVNGATGGAPSTEGGGGGGGVGTDRRALGRAL